MTSNPIAPKLLPCYKKECSDSQRTVVGEVFYKTADEIVEWNRINVRTTLRMFPLTTQEIEDMEKSAAISPLPEHPEHKSYMKCVSVFVDRIEREENPRIKEALTAMLLVIKQVAREDGVTLDN